MLTIVVPKVTDAEAIHAMIKASWYRTYVNKEIGVTVEDIDYIYAADPDSQINALRNRASDPQANDLSFVAKDEGQVLGYIRVKIHEESHELLTLYVHPEYTGRGIGSMLLKEMLIHLPKGIPMTLEVASYTRARDFYEKMGFVDTGERYDGEMLHVSGKRMPLMRMMYTPV